MIIALVGLVWGGLAVAVKLAKVQNNFYRG